MWGIIIFHQSLTYSTVVSKIHPHHSGHLTPTVEGGWEHTSLIREQRQVKQGCGSISGSGGWSEWCMVMCAGGGGGGVHVCADNNEV